jgi:hypothetical protein
VGNGLAIYYFLKCEFQKDPERWFNVREVASIIDLSINRTRSHLSLLCLSNELETKVSGWCNVYRFKR